MSNAASGEASYSPMNPDFEAMLDDNPADWTTRLVYSDWLYENGCPDMAEAMRWMAKNQRCPEDRGRQGYPIFNWFDGSNLNDVVQGRAAEVYEKRHSILPEEVFASMMSAAKTLGLPRRLSTRQAAEAILAIGLISLKRLREIEEAKRKTKKPRKKRKAKSP